MSRDFKEREMKNVERPIASNESKKNTTAHPRATFFFNPPLSDSEIIELQNLFMTPSIHYITTKNVSTGRYLMNLFLSVFRHYHNVGCLTTEQNQNLSERVFDLSHLQNSDTSLIDSIELFSIENPYLNFIWIELTQVLQRQISVGEVHKICEIFSSDEQTPVLVIRYEEDAN